MRMARKPSAVARELLRNFPKGGRRRRRRSKRDAGEGEGDEAPERERLEAEPGDDSAEAGAEDAPAEPSPA
jgi:hypothetical protein